MTWLVLGSDSGFASRVVVVQAGCHAKLSVAAWTPQKDRPFPLEAILVWLACPFICILLYEYFKFRKYRARAKSTWVHPSLRPSESVELT